MVLYGKYPLEMDVLDGNLWEHHRNIWGYPLVICSIAIEHGPVENIEIVSFPIRNKVIFDTWGIDIYNRGLHYGD